MPNHKLTLLGHPASKKIQTYLQQSDLHGTERRLAYADGVVAISGIKGIELARDLYKVDLRSAELLRQFHAMLGGFGFAKALNREADVCAEAHLWMTLVGVHSKSLQASQPPRHRHSHPRHLHVWVYEIDRKNRPKEDSPCQNCRQWVRQVFLTLNGTS